MSKITVVKGLPIPAESANKAMRGLKLDIYNLQVGDAFEHERIFENGKERRDGSFYANVRVYAREFNYNVDAIRMDKRFTFNEDGSLAVDANGEPIMVDCKPYDLFHRAEGEFQAKIGEKETKRAPAANSANA